MKLSGLSDSGVEAKAVIQNGEVTVNNSVCLERGKKLHNGDVFEYKGTVIKVIS